MIFCLNHCHNLFLNNKADLLISNQQNYRLFFYTQQNIFVENFIHNYFKIILFDFSLSSFRKLLLVLKVLSCL